MKQDKPRGRPPRMKDATPLTTWIPARHYDRISTSAIQRGKSVSEVVRLVLVRSRAFPTDK